MKVYYINAVCGTGSTGNIIAGLIGLLRMEGRRGRVAFGVGTANKVQPEEAFKFNTKIGYYFHNALARLTDHTGRYSVVQTWRLIRDIEKYDPDLIHLHNLHGYYVNYRVLFRYLKKCGKPVVWTLHDCWSLTGHCTHFVGANCDQWKTGCRRCELLREYPVCYTAGDVKGNYRRKKESFTSLSNLTIVTPSQWLADQVRQSFLCAYPVKIIHNGIDTDVFRYRESNFRQQYGLKEKKIVLGVAGVWSERKGLQDFYTLAERLPDDYQIVLVGLTSSQIEELPPKIIGISRTENAVQLAEIYSAADVFMNPTYEDTFPTVNLEAQACGTPVISYDVCGCPETILPGWGETILSGDIDGAVCAINRWCHTKEQVRGDRQLSKECCYAEYLDLYEQLI